jgi:hypothetical protein
MPKGIPYEPSTFECCKCDKLKKFFKCQKLRDCSCSCERVKECFKWQNIREVVTLENIKLIWKRRVGKLIAAGLVLILTLIMILLFSGSSEGTDTSSSDLDT